MQLITWKSTLYSLRLYVSAVLVLAIAFWQDFPFPYWAMTITYVLIQPSGDQTRLKAGHLLAGAVVGAAAGVVSAVLFATSPTVQLASLIVFMMITAVATLRDRRPRYYAYMLSGVTCLLIAMPGIATPDLAFERAVGRVQDAMLAIFTFVIVDAVLFPREQSSIAIPAVGQWLDDLRVATLSALRSHTIDPSRRLSIVQRAIQLVPIADGASRGGSFWHYRVLIAILERGMRLLPVLTAMTDMDRSSWTRGARVGDPAIRELLAMWIEEGCKIDASAASLRRQLRIRPSDGAPPSLNDALEMCYFRYLRAIYVGWRYLQRDLRIGESGARPPSTLRPSGRPVPATIGQVDLNFAVRGALSIGVYALLMGTLWSVTGWDASTMALSMLMGAAFCVTSGMADDPVLALISPAKIAGIAMLTVGFYVQIVFPSVDNFPVLALTLLPVLFALGLVVQRQGGVLFAILPMALLRIGNGQAGISIDGLLNSIIGLYIGIGIALIAKMLVQRTAFVDITRRLMYRNLRQLNILLHESTGPTQRQFLLDALDRFVLLETRAAKLAPITPMVDAGTRMLREIQIGRGVHALRRWAGKSPDRRTTLATVERSLAASLNEHRDPLLPWGNASLSSQMENQLNSLLTTSVNFTVPVRSLIELRVALGEMISPPIAPEPSSK